MLAGQPSLRIMVNPAMALARPQVSSGTPEAKAGKLAWIIDPISFLGQSQGFSEHFKLLCRKHGVTSAR
jgi:hypothetical protein